MAASTLARSTSSKTMARDTVDDNTVDDNTVDKTVGYLRKIGGGPFRRPQTRRGVHVTLGNNRYATWTTKRELTWTNTGSSTIHRTYYYFPLIKKKNNKS